MSQTTERNLLPLLVVKVLYFLLPLPITWLSLSLMSMHAKYYKLGVNMAANNGQLIFIFAPVLLVILYATAVMCLLLMRKYATSRWLGIGLGSLLMLTVGIGIFLIKSNYSADDSTEPPANMALFLEYYFDEMTARIPSHSNGTMGPSKPTPKH